MLEQVGPTSFIPFWVWPAVAVFVWLFGAGVMWRITNPLTFAAGNDWHPGWVLFSLLWPITGCGYFGWTVCDWIKRVHEPQTFGPKDDDA